MKGCCGVGWMPASGWKGFFLEFYPLLCKRERAPIHRISIKTGLITLFLQKMCRFSARIDKKHQTVTRVYDVIKSYSPYGGIKYVGLRSRASKISISVER
jgi:hypothetical protein